MKVQANSAPPGAFQVDPHPQKPGQVIVRFFESARPEIGTAGAEMWKYDEFTIVVPYSPTINQDIEKDLEGWLASVKSLDLEYVAEKEAKAAAQAELVEMAALVIDLEIQNALLEMGVQLDDL